MRVMLDDILRHVGEFGRYQRFFYVLVCINSFYSGTNNLLIVFTTYIPKHRCKLPGWHDDTYQIQSDTHNTAINTTIPVFFDNRSHAAYWNQCFFYSDNGTLVACTEWVYDMSVFTSSAITDFNLVCERKPWRAHARMSSMLGHMIGSLVFGALSDRIGRRKSGLFGLLLMAAAAMLTAASPNIFVFMAFTFLKSAGDMGGYMVIYGLAMETVGKRKRFHAGIIQKYFYGFGWWVMTLYAYFLRDWRHLQLVAGLPGVLFLSYIWFLPESVRWLLAKKRKAEAIVILQRISRTNKVQIKQSVLENLAADDSGSATMIRIWTFLRHKMLAVIFVIVLFNWITCALVYYGLGLNAGDLVGSIHLNVFLSGLMDIIGFCLWHVFINRIGRRLVFMSALFMGGVACLLTIFPILYLAHDYQWLTVVLAMVGKLGIVIAFDTVYIHTTEIFPTVVRTSSLGVASMVARVGSVVSPYITDLSLVIQGDIGRAVPLMIFGIVAVTAGLLSLYLPETINKRLPETIDDCKNLKQKRTPRIEEERDAFHPD